MEITALLDELAEIRAARDLTRLNYEARRDEILAKVKDELDEVDAEFKPLLSVADTRTEELEGIVKNATIERGESVKGSSLHAVYISGRTTWDGKGLDGFSAAHPEILRFRKTGEPSVTIRSTKS